MASDGDRVPLPASVREPLEGARAVGAPDATEQLSVTLVLRRRTGDPEVHGDVALPQRRYLSRSEFASQYAVDEHDLALVRAFAQAENLTIAELDPVKRIAVLRGTAADCEHAFGVTLLNYQTERLSYRGRAGPVYIPRELEGVVQAVLGLDDRPQGRPDATGGPPADPLASALYPSQVAQLYDFPAAGAGDGQTVGLLQFGGGYKPEDLQAYFGALGLAVPSIAVVAVDGVGNQPTGDAHGLDAEVMTDIEVLGAVAPHVKMVLYFAPNTSQGFVDALSSAVHDDTNRPAVISISWGAPESGWTTQAMMAFDRICADAATMGITICASAGDRGSADGVLDGAPHVHFPASSPHVLACGGTSVTVADGKIVTETVWNDGGGATGGGVSTAFPRPAWQAASELPSGRGVPDVAAHADPAGGYRLRVDGRDLVTGGTSAATPLWAGLIALMNGQLPAPAGFLNPLLYADPARGTFRPITQGGNDVSGLGVHKAGAGWNPCTGLGSPSGASLLRSLAGVKT